MVEYIEASEIKERALELASRFELKHINFEKVHFFRYTSDTRTIAKVGGFSKIMQLVYPHINPFYVIVFNDRNFQRISKREQDETILHELLHIPKTFSGEYSRIAHAKIRELSKQASKDL